MNKSCFKCKESKLLEEFYRHPQMGDGYLNKCKECTKLDTRKNRADRLDYYRDYDKHRAMQPHRIAARHQYQNTDEGRSVLGRAKKKWAEKNPIKRAAQVSVGNAIRDGKLEKPKNCEECGVLNVRIHGHHDDYAKPLDVRWLCAKCHSDWHRDNGPGMNAETRKTG